MQKVDLSPALAVPLALGCRGGKAVKQNLDKFLVTEKLSAVTQHPVALKITAKIDVLWTALGLILIFHGAQFRNLFICVHIVLAVCYSRVKDSVSSLYNDVTVATEKMKADEGGDAQSATADAKAEAKPESNKHAKKREDKKGAASATSEDHVAMATKALKILDSEKLSKAAFDIFSTFMACLLAIHGGIVQHITIGHSLVRQFEAKVDASLEFSSHEDVKAWTDLLVRFVLYTLFVGLAAVAGPLALALTVSACGAQIAVEHGLQVLEGIGKVESASNTMASQKGLFAMLGLTVFGTAWQLWTWMAGGGMAWYFQALYLPAVIAEGILGFF